jgi:hypothetical protein
LPFLAKTHNSCSLFSFQRPTVEPVELAESTSAVLYKTTTNRQGRDLLFATTPAADVAGG